MTYRCSPTSLQALIENTSSSGVSLAHSHEDQTQLFGEFMNDWSRNDPRNKLQVHGRKPSILRVGNRSRLRIGFHGSGCYGFGKGLPASDGMRMAQAECKEEVSGTWRCAFLQREVVKAASPLRKKDLCTQQVSYLFLVNVASKETCSQVRQLCTEIFCNRCVKI